MKIIDINHWQRKSHFNFFSGMDYPHLNICFDVDITATRSYANDQGLKLSNLILYFSTYAANQIPEMKIRIRDDQVVEHELVHPSFTVLGENNVFNYCNAEDAEDNPIGATLSVENNGGLLHIHGEFGTDYLDFYLPVGGNKATYAISNAEGIYTEVGEAYMTR